MCATLILEQTGSEKGGQWVGRRNEVRIDARPSDCLVLALKNRAEIQVTREVFEEVQDVSSLAIADLTGADWASVIGADVSAEAFETDLLSSWEPETENEGDAEVDDEQD